MLRLLITGVAALALLSMAGCPPPSYGIFGYANLDSAPSMECVRRVLSAQKIDGTLEFDDHEGGRRLTPKGILPPTRAQTFSYVVGETRYAFQFVSDAGEPIRYRQYGFAAKSAPLHLLRALREHLETVSRGIQDQCGVRQLVERIREECKGDNCPTEKSAA